MNPLNFFILPILKSRTSKNAVCVLVILVFKCTLFCQTFDTTLRAKPYHVNYLTGSAILAAGLVTDYFAIAQLQSKAAITQNNR